MGSSSSKRFIDVTSSRSQRSLDLNKCFNELYDISEEVGLGSFASVNKCIRKSDSTTFAAKISNTKYLTNDEINGLKNEVKILKQISHDNIISLTDVFDDGKTVHLVMELCDGKDLFDKICECKTTGFAEHKAAEIVHTLSNALLYIHQNGIIHRDLKPENILFSIDGTLKITDFGLAYASTVSAMDSFDSIVTNTCCGTPHYVAPEVIAQQYYNYKVDLWSLGVILYLMLVAYQPFRARTLNEIYGLIVKGRYNFKSRRWKNISDEAKHLVRCLLNIDPEKRYSSSDIQCHPWIIQHINNA